jgi:hypothetical protein
MVNIKTLLPDLKELVKELDEDLLARAIGNPEIDAGLREAFTQIEKGGRTAQAYEVWREDYLDQVAVAWVLACVFVRFMEDNHLIDECWLAGVGERRRLAEDTHELFFRQHPHDTDREYFQHVFHEVGKIPAAKDLFAEGKTPLWAVTPSGDAAMKLLAFWREMQPETGHLKRSFEVEGGDTRFLGDLYQELSERAKKKYALLQTPVFVEEFILDRTLDLAIDEFGLDTVRMIDPTCGSGHFLLGGFARLFRLWMKRESNEIVAAQKALDGVWGVDINPFAVAIARFRLIVAAVQACGIKRLKDASGWTIHLATGDSLLFGSRWSRTGDKVQEQSWFATDEGSWAPEIYACEDKDALQEVLGQQYHAVVGNPPYITVKDKSLNDAYRGRYTTCHRKYSLAVPFVERFFDLALAPEDGHSGYVGMITANSFMKREFGKKLIEEFFPHIDLTHVIDTSGMGPTLAGHGTPTAIIFGRNRKPQQDTVRAVFGIRGEPGIPEDLSRGFVWLSILKNIDLAEAYDEFTSTRDVPRSTFSRHPWNIGGGGAAELSETLEEAGITTLGEVVSVIGVFGMTNADEVFVADLCSLSRKDVEITCIRQLQAGNEVRDWSMQPSSYSIFPYSSDGELYALKDVPGVYRWLWRAKTILGNRATFDKSTYFAQGLPWWKWHQVSLDRLRIRLTIVYPNIASGNHAVLDRSGRLFNVTALIIQLPVNATDNQHLAILGFLNSSIASFWVKQRFQTKGTSGTGRGIYDERWEFFYQVGGIGLSAFPIAEQGPIDLARPLDQLGREYAATSPECRFIDAIPTASELDESRRRAVSIRGRMIALQEELDWQCYHLYGLLSEDLRYDGGDLPELCLGQRAFEIVMARQMVKNELTTSWFERHGSTSIIELPGHWPEPYRTLVERRIKIIETNNEIGLIERPEYKRRWNEEPWEDQQQRALRNWLLDRLESYRFWPDASRHEPALQTTAQLADKASGDHAFLQVAALYRGRPDFDVAALVNELVESESVPFLPVLRYKPSGLRKREVWERTWDLQRKQDAEEDVGDIPVPPKYTSADFLKQDYWRLRGKLDVPKERWISYPHLQTESDSSLVVGWAGWNHLQQATALVSYYDARKREGWDSKRLTPILAGLDQLLSWIHQWHPEIDPEFGDTAGQSYQSLLENDAHELGLTLEDIRNWQPPATARKARTTRRAKLPAEDDQ